MGYAVSVFLSLTTWTLHCQKLLVSQIMVCSHGIEASSIFILSFAPICNSHNDLPTLLQVLRKQPHGTPADIYSLGCFLLEMIVGIPYDLPQKVKGTFINPTSFRMHLGTTMLPVYTLRIWSARGIVRPIRNPNKQNMPRVFGEMLWWPDLVRIVGKQLYEPPSPNKWSGFVRRGRISREAIIIMFQLRELWEMDAELAQLICACVDVSDTAL